MNQDYQKQRTVVALFEQYYADVARDEKARAQLALNDAKDQRLQKLDEAKREKIKRDRDAILLRAIIWARACEHMCSSADGTSASPYRTTSPFCSARECVR